MGGYNFPQLPEDIWSPVHGPLHPAKEKANMEMQHPIVTRASMPFLYHFGKLLNKNRLLMIEQILFKKGRHP